MTAATASFWAGSSTYTVVRRAQIGSGSTGTGHRTFWVCSTTHAVVRRAQNAVGTGAGR